MMKRNIFYAVGFFIIISTWYLLSIIFSKVIIPYPHTIFFNLAKILSQKSIYLDLLITFSRTLIGFFLSFISGAFIGYLMGRSDIIEKSLYIPTILIQASPPLLWVIPLILILGTKGVSTIAMIYFITLPLIIINIFEGRKSIDKSYYDMFKIYADSRYLRIKELFIPYLVPHIKTILTLGIVLSLKSSIIGEWFGSKNGIGRKINEYFYSYDLISLYSYSLIFLVLVTLTAILTKYIASALLPDKSKSKNIPTFSKMDISKNEIITPSYAELEGVSFFYNKKIILNKTDFKIERGETVLLTGESGVGKTTLARLLVGLLDVNMGKVILPDNSGFIFQNDLLLNHLDCFGNLKLTAQWKNIDYPDKKCLYYLQRCGLSDSVNLFPDELSGGMKKRLSLARAMILNPSFMILDEPFNNLDKEARDKLWELYFELFSNRGITSMIITHYPEELSSRKLKTYKLTDGKITLIG